MIVIKKLMDRYKNDKSKIKIIFKNLMKDLNKMIQNPFGNYLIQHAFDNYDFKTIRPMLNSILKNIINFSIKKISSNVIEKCFTVSTPAYKKKFILEIT